MRDFLLKRVGFHYESWKCKSAAYLKNQMKSSTKKVSSYLTNSIISMFCNDSKIIKLNFEKCLTQVALNTDRKKKCIKHSLKVCAKRLKIISSSKRRYHEFQEKWQKRWNWIIQYSRDRFQWFRKFSICFFYKCFFNNKKEYLK